MAYDPKCQEVSEYFLPTGVSDRLKTELAQHIQDSIEDWLEGERDRIEVELVRKPS